MKSLYLVNSLMFIFILAAQAQEPNLSLERIYSSDEFSSERAKSLRWHDGGNAYTTLEPSSTLEVGMDIVRHDTRTGEQSILVSAEMLVPAGANEPIQIANYIWSTNKSKLLLFTNTQRVWRYHTKGDYYVLDLTANTLHKLGGENDESTPLMFAKFSPDASQVGYVRDHNIFVESLVNGDINQLTSDGSDKIINGTFDWAYEEEFGCRDGFRWSPDGSKIAFWRIDATHIRDFLMINNTDNNYSYTIPVSISQSWRKTIRS